MRQVRQAPPRARPYCLRPLRSQAQQGLARPRCPVESRGQTAPRPGPSPILRAPALPPAGRRPVRSGPVHPMRSGAGRPGAKHVRGLRRKAPRLGPGALRGGQRGGAGLRRSRRRRQTARRPRRQQAAPAGPPRGGVVHPLRQASARPGGNDLRAMQGGEAGGGTAAICRTKSRRALHPLRRTGLRRSVALRPLRRDRRRKPVA